MKISVHPTSANTESSNKRTLSVLLSLSGENITLSPLNTVVYLKTDETAGEEKSLRTIVRGGELRCPITESWEFGDTVKLEIQEKNGADITKDLTEAVQILSPNSTEEELRAAVASLLVE